MQDEDSINIEKDHNQFTPIDREISNYFASGRKRYLKRQSIIQQKVNNRGKYLQQIESNILHTRRQYLQKIVELENLDTQINKRRIQFNNEENYLKIFRVYRMHNPKRAKRNQAEEKEQEESFENFRKQQKTFPKIIKLNLTQTMIAKKWKDSKKVYTTQKNLERKIESNLGQSSFPQPQPFSQSQQPGEEQKKVQKTAHATTPTSQEKPRKQMKSAFHQEVSEFNPSGQISMEQLIKVILNLQKDVRKLKKDNDKLKENLNKQEQIESRLMSQERDQELSETFHKIKETNLEDSNRSRQNLEIQQRKQKKPRKKLQLQMEIREQKSDLMLIEEEIIRKPKKKSSKQRLEKNAFVAEAYDIYIGNERKSSRKN